MSLRSVLLGVASSGLLIGAVMGQTSHPEASRNTTQMPTNGNAPSGHTAATANTPERAEANQQSLSQNQTRNDQTAAGGHNNQAVATTDAAQPAKGANSFTEAQARTRLEKNGFQNVSELKKDDDGIWRGTAERDGSKLNVWEDYKGNVGVSNAGQ
jgi:putative membrane protein